MATRSRTSSRSRRNQSTADSNGFAVADIATGAVLGVAGAASHPLQTIRGQARGLRRRGEPVNEEIARSAYGTGRQVYETGEGVASGRLPERFALEGVRLVKRQARRDDVIGDIAYGALSAINSVVKRAMGTLSKFESDSEPPRREGERSSTSTRRRRTSATASRSSRGGRRTTSRRSASASASGDGEKATTRRRRSTGTRRSSSSRAAASTRRRPRSGAASQTNSANGNSTSTRSRRSTSQRGRSTTGGSASTSSTRTTRSRRARTEERRVEPVASPETIMAPQAEILATPELVAATADTQQASS